MGKLVVLKIMDGSFDQGFTVMLQIGDEGARPSIETTGRLPALPEMPLYYSRWQDSYWRLESRYRISPKKGQNPNVSLVEDCHSAAYILRARMNTWLLSEEFRPVREKWLERLSPDEAVRIILQTEDSQLRRLPWNLLDFMERYPKAEIALSALNSEAPTVQRSHLLPHINILSILGNSEGIDTQADRVMLETLPNAKVTTLVEPDRKQLTDQLWGEPWDILFFAGHSSSQGAGETGRIFLNKTDSLTISELKYALRKSVENGLQLAVFNSCDGLGLARELADLRIPQIIVMREPVPDLVAQEFLKNFLREYASGTSFYIAVREARERLQGMEDRFPCASWLPLICQHPAAIPPTWRELTQPEVISEKRLSLQRTLAIALLTSLAATALVGGIRFWGGLQTLELLAYDHMMQLRPEEPPDSRLLVVTIDDEDLRQQQQTEDLKNASISDRNLSRLLTLLTNYQPKAIGLDIYRDRPTDAARYPDLVKQLKSNNGLIAICKGGYEKASSYGTAPPPEIPKNSSRVGFSDFILTPDEVVRRSLMAMNFASLTDSGCQVPSALSTELVVSYFYNYLDGNQTGVDPEWGDNFKLRLGTQPKDLPTVDHGYFLATRSPLPNSWQPYEVLFPKLQVGSGGYQGQGNDYNGTQILLNYRALKNPADIATRRPLRWLLSTQNPPSAQELTALIKDKVVLIGVTAREREDLFKTPYGKNLDERLPGVFVHAHMVSQILSAVLDGRPLLWVWTPWLELAWIGGWAGVGGLIAAGLYLGKVSSTKRLPALVLAISLATGLLYGVCVVVFIGLGGWLPFVPAVLTLVFTGSAAFLLLRRAASSLQPA